MDKKTSSAYLKAIYLLEEEGKGATTLSIANALLVKPASVTEMLGKLVYEGYITHKPYKEAALTSKGRYAAMKIIRKHRLLETFLKTILRLDDKEVCGQAGALGHSLSDHADQQLCIFLHRPKSGIDGKPIVHCTKKISCNECLRNRIPDHGKLPGL